MSSLADGNARKKWMVVYAVGAAALLIVGYAGMAPTNTGSVRRQRGKQNRNSTQGAIEIALKWEKKAIKGEPLDLKYLKAERRAAETTPELVRTTKVGDTPSWNELFENNVDLASDFNR